MIVYKHKCECAAECKYTCVVDDGGWHHCNCVTCQTAKHLDGDFKQIYVCGGVIV